MRDVWFALGLVSLVLVLVGSCAAPYAIHDLKMARYRHGAASIPLTEGRVVDSMSRFGLLSGSSNHCDAEVWVLIDSALPPEGFVRTLPEQLVVPEPFTPAGPVPWSSSFNLWEVADDGRFYGIGDDGAAYPLDADQSVPALNRFLELQGLFDLSALAESHPVIPGRHRYALQAMDQSFGDFDMMDFRCH